MRILKALKKNDTAKLFPGWAERWDYKKLAKLFRFADRLPLPEIPEKYSGENARQANIGKYSAVNLKVRLDDVEVNGNNKYLISDIIEKILNKELPKYKDVSFSALDVHCF